MRMTLNIIVVMIEEKRIEYYDHLYRNSDDGIACLAAMKRWVADVFKDKNDEILDMSQWDCEDMSDKIPLEARQTDWHSCGPFAIGCLELIVANLLWRQERWYTQSEMQVHFRYRGMVEIHKGRIDY